MKWPWSKKEPLPVGLMGKESPYRIDLIPVASPGYTGVTWAFEIREFKQWVNRPESGWGMEYEQYPILFSSDAISYPTKEEARKVAEESISRYEESEVRRREWKEKYKTQEYYVD